MENKELEIEQINEQKAPTHYVGIGASAGGLEALEVYFEHIPNNTGMSFIVVQHLSPDYKSMMVELLLRRTRMKVIQIEDGMQAEANCIYLIPPKKNLTIFHSKLILTEQIRNSTLNLPIDIFFRSLAIDQQKKAVGVILSGTGSDGTLGIKAIKEQGGLVMVQDYNNAKFDGMPKSAISTGLVDYILDADKMGDALVKYVSHPSVLNDELLALTSEETDFIKILSLIRTNLGEDFSYYKPKTIIRRIERRISVNQLQDSDEYIKLLLNSKNECETLAKEFLIGVTQFFRDKEAWQIIEKDVLPKILDKKEQQANIRFWSAGCSTGEEAYSMAILCREYMDSKNLNLDLKIFATDLDKAAVKFAGYGIYPESIVADVPQEYLYKYFIKKEGSYQVNEIIRQMVIFANHNVTNDPPFSKISLVTCRNLLIYFKTEMQQKVQHLFQYSLSKGGFLFLGSSESLNGSLDAFEIVSSKWKIFKYKENYLTPPLANLINPQNQARTVVSSIPKVQESVEQKVATSDFFLYEKALNFFAPAGVIVDKNNNIIHFFKDVKRFFEFPEGKASFNLLELANNQLSIVLSNLLHKARKEKSEVNLNKFKFKEGEKIIFLNLSAKVISLNRTKNEYVVLAITEEQRHYNTEINSEIVFNYDEQAAERIRELEQELQFRDENLQTTVEELETSNEELQATNEELVSSNEELQSTNEELQSVNEELYTVNSQYQSKINDLTELNNDINNLLVNTRIGTLFLDSQLFIRKFTSEITNTINVMEIDIGRPFSHITFNCNYMNLYEDVNSVLNTLIIKEIEVKANNGSWYLIKIQPYRHADRSIHGILITQININTLKKTRIINLKLSQAIEQSANSVIITDTEGNIEYANKKFIDISGYPMEECIGRNSRFLKSGKHSFDFYQKLWDTISNKKTWKGEILNKSKSGFLYWENCTISAIKNSQGDIINYLGIKEDISDKKHMEEMLLIKRTILESNRQISNVGSWELDVVKNELKWSPETYRIFGLEPNSIELTFEKFLEFIYPEDKEMVESSYSKAIKEQKPYLITHRIIRADGEVRVVKENSIELRNSEGEIIRSVGSVIDITELFHAQDYLIMKEKELEIAKLELERALAEKREIIEDKNLLLKQYSESNNHLKKILNLSDQAFVLCKVMYDEKNKAFDYEYIDFNIEFLNLVGYTREELISRVSSEIFQLENNNYFEQFVDVSQNDGYFEFEVELGVKKEAFIAKCYSPRKDFFALIFNLKM